MSNTESIQFAHTILGIAEQKREKFKEMYGFDADRILLHPITFINIVRISGKSITTISEQDLYKDEFKMWDMARVILSSHVPRGFVEVFKAIPDSATG